MNDTIIIFYFYEKYFSHNFIKIELRTKCFIIDSNSRQKTRRSSPLNISCKILVRSSILNSLYLRIYYSFSFIRSSIPTFDSLFFYDRAIISFPASFARPVISSSLLLRFNRRAREFLKCHFPREKESQRFRI